jgi:hypothetical protein
MKTKANKIMRRLQSALTSTGVNVELDQSLVGILDGGFANGAAACS